MKTWVKCVYMGQEFVVNNIVRFYGSESQFAIHDDPGAGSRSTIRDPKIVTSLHRSADKIMTFVSEKPPHHKFQLYPNLASTWLLV